MRARQADFFEEPALRYALNARPTASQGFATAGLLKKMEKRKDPFLSNKEDQELRKGGCHGRRNEAQVGPNESIKRGQIKLTNAYVHCELRRQQTKP